LALTEIDGIPVSRVTDQATCPRHKGAYPIVDGDPTMIVHGQPVALPRSSLACGCKVLSARQLRVIIDSGGNASGATPPGITDAAARATARHPECGSRASAGSATLPAPHRAASAPAGCTAPATPRPRSHPSG